MSNSKPENVIRSAPKNKNIVITVAAVVVFVGLIIFFWPTQNNKDTAFIINGTRYSKPLVSRLAAVSLSGASESTADSAKRVFDYYKEEVAAQQLGLVPDENLVKQELANLYPPDAVSPTSALLTSEIAKSEAAGYYKPDLPKSPTNDPYTNLWLHMLAYHNALKDSYVALSQGIYHGYSFTFDFSGKILPERLDHPTPGYGDKQLIAKDQAYALQQANYYHGQIANKQITADQLLAKMKQDYRLGLKDESISFSTFDSRKIDNSVDPYLQGQVYFKDIANYIMTQSQPGLSAVKTATVPTAKLSTSANDYVPGVYYFVDLTKARKGYPNPEQAISDKINHTKATYYGI